MAQLNRYWGDEIAKAESRKNAGEHWVKMLNLPTEMTRRDLEDILRDWDLVPRRVNKIENVFMFSLDMESDRAKLLRYHNYKVGENRIAISRARAKLTPTEIFDFISDRLQTLEQAEYMRRAVHGYYEDRGGMHAVDITPTTRPDRVTVVDPPQREASTPQPTQTPMNRDPLPMRQSLPKLRPTRSNSPVNTTPSVDRPRIAPPPVTDVRPKPPAPSSNNRSNSNTRNEGPGRTDWGQRPSNQFRGRDDTPQPTYTSQINQTSGERAPPPSANPPTEVYYPFRPASHNRPPAVNTLYQAPGPRVQT